MLIQVFYYKTRPIPPCRILSAMAQRNPASTPHGFVPGSPQAPKTRPTKLGINCFNMPWFWTLFFRCRMLQSPHLNNEPSSALIPYVRPDSLPLAEYFLLWLGPTLLPRLTVLFPAAHRPQNISYKVMYQLP